MTTKEKSRLPPPDRNNVVGPFIPGNCKPPLVSFTSPDEIDSRFCAFSAGKNLNRLDLMFVGCNGVLSAAILSERKRHFRTIHGNDIRRTKGGEYLNSNMAQATYSNHYHPLPRPHHHPPSFTPLFPRHPHYTS